MAIINILGKSTKNVDWNGFLKDYLSLNVVNVEVFPIPKELGFDCDSIGFNIHRGYLDSDAVIYEIKHFVAFFSSKPYNFKFIELYDGVEIHTENVTVLIRDLLSI